MRRQEGKCERMPRLALRLEALGDVPETADPGGFMCSLTYVTFPVTVGRPDG